MKVTRKKYVFRTVKLQNTGYAHLKKTVYAEVCLFKSHIMLNIT